MKITSTRLRSLIAETLQEMNMDPEEQQRLLALGEHPEITWHDFKPYGMDQVGEAFMAAGGDPMEALQILQMGDMAAEEDFDEDEVYPYGDDPEEFLDLPAGEIQRRLRGED